jgi:hypothetical protein
VTAARLDGPSSRTKGEPFDALSAASSFTPATTFNVGTISAAIRPTNSALMVKALFSPMTLLAIVASAEPTPRSGIPTPLSSKKPGVTEPCKTIGGT